MKKKIDNRIRILIENGMLLGHRTLVALVGDKSRDQVFLLVICAAAHLWLAYKNCSPLMFWFCLSTFPTADSKHFLIVCSTAHPLWTLPTEMAAVYSQLYSASMV